jgi:tetratricopeptide (TPR) repeat protein
MRRKSMIGDLLGSPAMPNLGNLSGAMDQYRQSAAILEENLAADSRDAQAMRGLALLYRKMANVERETSPRAAATLYNNALRHSAALLALTPSNRDFQRAHANSLSGLGEALRVAGDRAGAAAKLKEARILQESLISADPSRTVYKQDLVTTEHRLGDLWLDMNDLAAARTAYRQALERTETMPPANPYTQFLLADCYDRLGRLIAVIATRRNDAEAWRDARAWHNKSAALWRGTSGVSVYSRARLAAVEKSISACDKALASLK